MVMQRIANPPTPVRFRLRPPHSKPRRLTSAGLFCGRGKVKCSITISLARIDTNEKSVRVSLDDLIGEAKAGAEYGVEWGPKALKELRRPAHAAGWQLERGDNRVGARLYWLDVVRVLFIYPAFFKRVPLKVGLTIAP